MAQIDLVFEGGGAQGHRLCRCAARTVGKPGPQTGAPAWHIVRCNHGDIAGSRVHRSRNAGRARRKGRRQVGL